MAGLRDWTILSVVLQVGLRRAEIAGLTVGDLHQNRGYDALRLTRKGGRRDALAINPQVAACIRAYLDQAGHGAEHEMPLFRPLKGNEGAPFCKPHGPGCDRSDGPEVCGGDWAGAELLGSLDAGDVHQHGTGERGAVGVRAESGRAPRS